MPRRRNKRTGARGAWYIWYRQLRIVRRETNKAYLDMLIYGTGYTLITDEPDYIRHIPIQEVMFDAPPSPPS